MTDKDKSEKIEQILDTPDLADALESDRFKQFLDQVPVAIAISDLKVSERIIYVNLEFKRLTQLSAADAVGKSWNLLDRAVTDAQEGASLGKAISDEQEHIGVFTLKNPEQSVNVWSNVIEDDQGTPVFRLVAIATIDNTGNADRAAIVQQLADKDTLLRELQHRVKNNLQMITALIRLEARNLPQKEDHLDRLAGRVEALALLYQSLSEQGIAEEIDLGIYLSQVASAVMRAHGVEGIRLDLKVDTWPVSINVAMPTGLVVNELLTNSLKHGFKGRDGGTIILHSLVDESGCRVIVADDGIGLPDGMEWPKSGKLGALIINSLRTNAKAMVDVESEPGRGVRVTIRFARAAAAANTAGDPIKDA